MRSKSLSHSVRARLIFATVIACTLYTSHAAPPPPADAPASTALPMPGFTAGHAASEAALEKKFDTHISGPEMRAWLQQLAAAPNHVGSPHDKANAEFMLSKFREWGWDAQIETFDVLYPTLKSHSLELVAPTTFKARLTEPPVAGDATSTQVADELPPYNVYGADGDVTANLVYVNQGMPDDYKELALHGISVSNCIVITRYGGGWRGLKPKLAFEHGAIGCLIYSDPRDDGYSAGDVYPKGPWRPDDGVQRGSVADMPVYPGDPLTPGYGSTAGAKRLTISEARTILKIPVMPISYADAEPFLAALGGPVAPENWRGGLPVTYHLGPGPARVHLAISSDWSQKPIYDVIAKISGSTEPDQWVIRGNHHDGWVFGAWDPLSGNIALMAEAQAIGALVREGWHPRRTLVYCGWDGEEPGLLGSTEWAETHLTELRQKALLYVNSDSNGRGFLSAGGSQQWQSLANSIAAAVTDPETRVSALARLRARILVRADAKGADDEAKAAAKIVADSPGAPISALGSGSDYTVFLQHAGIATLDFGFGGEAKNEGIYHSAYDSFDHFDRFGDPGYAYSAALAQVVGRTILRASEADVAPMRFGDFASSVARYVDELHKLADSMRDRADRQHKLLEAGAYTLADDPTGHLQPPERLSAVPFLNLAPLDNAVLRLRQNAKTCDEAMTRSLAAQSPATAEQLNQANEILRGLEQNLIDSRGLPGRDWFQHMIYAPGLHTGYGVKTLPGVREAIEEQRWSEADEYAPRIAAALDRFSTQLNQIAAILSPSTKK